MDYLEELKVKLLSLAVLRGVLDNNVMKTLCGLLGARNDSEPEKASRWGAFAAALYTQGGNLTRHVLSLVLGDDNAYIRARAKGEAPGCMEESLMRELSALQDAASLTPLKLGEMLGLDMHLAGWETEETDFAAEYEKMLRELPTRGWGIFRKHGMLRLNAGEPLPVLWPDTVRLSDLKGYERERGAVIENTLALIEGRPAANALLYGDAGTGKSSTVKAIANEYRDRGLRLIEVPKSEAGGISSLIGELADNPLKFILYIDDLSFTGESDEFHALKAVLEGSASGRAGNIVIYATSNRRHLMKELFSDLKGDDMHINETIQETVSLSSRFGLVVGFFKPGKELYLRIVKELAQQYGVVLTDERLELEAERFASMGRSGRAARQFVERLMRENK